MFQSYLTGIEILNWPEWQRTIICSNRTLLELKLFELIDLLEGLEVPIVPYWNWNYHIEMFPRRNTCVPIVPYWNWNQINDGLGLRFVHVPIVPYWNWNDATLTRCLYSMKVPIVPYWNWNNDFTKLLHEPASSNRTLLELKYRKPFCRSLF